MTHERDIERILGHWFGDGPSEVPDRVMDVVADRIARQPQRPAWRLHWREPTMNTMLRAAAGIAAVLVVAVGAIYVLRSAAEPGIGAPPATTSPSPTGSPSAVPTLKTTTSSMFQPTLSVEAPADWNVRDGDRTFLLEAPGTPSGANGTIGVMTGPFVRFDDRDCEDRAPAGVGTSVAEVVATLAADPRIVTTGAQAVTIDGFTGQMLDVQVAPDWTGTCGWSDAKPAAVIISATDTGPAFGTGGTGRDRYIFLDVGGSLVAIDIGVADGIDFEGFVAQAAPILESLRFTP
jgi:hypothetical protein